jgi:ribosomal protein S18 acetylase RimI-like enzyme
MVTIPKDNGLSLMSILDSMNVRLAKPEDAAMIESFSAAMALETEGRRLDLNRLHEGTIALLESPDRGFFMVAELDQANDRRLLGQLMITYEWSDWRNGVFWWIQSVYVEPAMREGGVYRTMHDYVLQEAQRRPDVCGIRLYVEKDNVAAQAAYRRLGMRMTGYHVFEQDFVL